MILTASMLLGTAGCGSTPEETTPQQSQQHSDDSEKEQSDDTTDNKQSESDYTTPCNLSFENDGAKYTKQITSESYTLCVEAI